MSVQTIDPRRDGASPARKRKKGRLPPFVPLIRTTLASPVTTRSPPRRRGQQNFCFAAKRRREIVLHARHVGAAQTDDFDRWLIAWVWHNCKAKDQIWSVMECAKNLGGKITEAQASEITEEASITRKHLSADSLARFLGVTYADRQTLRLTTIGSVNVKKGARKELRRREDRLYQERRRRERGARPHSESLSRTKPWEAMKMSRRTWYRKNKSRSGTSGTTSSAAIFLSTADESVPPEGAARGNSCGAVAPKKARGLPSSQTATTTRVDMSELPMELRLLALGLPVPENLARAA
jgi:hypothetical protein